MSLDIFKTRDQRMLAKFIDQLFVMSGRREFPFVEFLTGVSKIGVSVHDWKIVFDEFVMNGWLLFDGKTVTLGKAFDYLSRENLEKKHIIYGLETIREVCTACLGKEYSFLPLYEQVKRLEDILNGRRDSTSNKANE